jgi:hypothetical protein
MHHSVQVESLKSHLVLEYVARTDHVTVGATSRRRLFTSTPHLYLENRQLRDLSCIENFQTPLTSFYHHVYQAHHIIRSDSRHD